MFNVFQKLLLAVALFSTINGETWDCPTDPVSPDSNGVWTSLNYPGPYENATNVCKLKYNKDDCYGIYITIDDLDINGKVHDFLIIKTGSEDMIEDKDEGKIFTWSIDSEANPRKYLFHGDEISMIFVGHETLNYTGFKLTYECNGDVVTTEEPITTTVSPWPAPNSTEFYTVFLKSITAYDFAEKKHLDQFLNMLINMTVEYCAKVNIALNETYPPLASVNLAKQCSYTWPNYEKCVEVSFAVTLPNTENEEYQLTRRHLSEMWISMSDRYLPQLDLSEYYAPDLHREFVVWIVVICVTLVVLFAYLLILRNYGIKCNTDGLKKRRKSDVQEIIAQDNNDFPEFQIGQHSLQTTPPLFDSEYTTYEPDKPEKGMPPNSYNSPYMYALNDETDSDEDEILSLPPPHSPAIYFDNPNFETDT